ncbi:hypothetical protein FIBSPDRAFT_866754 [Athelia psychrophila]|uniref:Uncharacterized protein n=1 Tax=Athelia psychrophila TaxID=1759441 RepID=A0A166EKM2_9AGAM|nr:hypothetical protein FIBSPDRAFT_866754 [Fibularhizoctonia sp. CBS 109695]
MSMFTSLVRRISGSFLPRSDRPWPEDATSTAPTIGRKRRLSTPPDEEEENIAKRLRGNEEALTRDVSPAQVPVNETEEVKEVTQGVNDVELDETKPETVPLPVTPPPETLELDTTPAEATEEMGIAIAETNPINAKIASAAPSAVTDVIAEEDTISEPLADDEALTTKNPISSTTSEPTTEETLPETTAKSTEADVQVADHIAADESEKVAEVEKTEESAL